MPIRFPNADRYQAPATGVQALGVTVALVFGAGALLADPQPQGRPGTLS